MKRSRTFYGLERREGHGWLSAFPTMARLEDWTSLAPEIRDYVFSGDVHVDAKKSAKTARCVKVYYVDGYWRLA